MSVLLRYRTVLRFASPKKEVFSLFSSLLFSSLLFFSHEARYQASYLRETRNTLIVSYLVVSISINYFREPRESACHRAPRLPRMSQHLRFNVVCLFLPLKQRTDVSLGKDRNFAKLSNMYTVFRNLWELIVRLKIMKNSRANICPVCLRL